MDGNYVEFVLGSAPDYVAEPHLSQTKDLSVNEVAKMPPNTFTWNAYLNDFHKRTTHIWMLHFNRCAEFKSSSEGLKKLVHSFFRNDPYFRRPHAELSRDRELWNVFRESYLSTAKICVKKGKTIKKFEEFPTLFLDMVDQEQKRRLEMKKAQDGCEFRLLMHLNGGRGQRDRQFPLRSLRTLRDY
jgi:hypothetical protein